MEYRAAIDFTDLQDRNRLYHAGERFPREGLTVSAERLDELATDKNRAGFPLIVAIEPEAPAKPVEKPTRKRVKKDA